MSLAADEPARLRRRLVPIAVLTRLVPACLVGGTEDVSVFGIIARAVIAGKNPYAVVPISWPPLWPSLIPLSQKITDTTGIPFPVTEKLWGIAADVLITLVLFSAVSGTAGARNAFRLAVLYAANPISIFVTAVHGQFDSLPALCTLLAVVFAGAGEARVSAVWTGIGALAKTWPLFTLPAFVSPRALRRSLRYSVIAIAPAAVTMAILLALTPDAVSQANGDELTGASRAILYRGAPGWWGTTGIAFLLGGEAAASRPALGIFLYAGWLLTAIILWTRDDAPAVKVLALLLSFLAFAPGFGIQYLVWIVPVGLLVDGRRTFLYSCLAAGVAVFEIVMRPHTGLFGENLANVPSRAYLDAYGQLRDRTFCILDRMPVWAFCCYWWGVLVIKPLFVRRGA